MNNVERNQVLGSEESQDNIVLLMPQNDISTKYSSNEDDGILSIIKRLVVKKWELYVRIDETNEGVLI